VIDPISIIKPIIKPYNNNLILFVSMGSNSIIIMYKYGFIYWEKRNSLRMKI